MLNGTYRGKHHVWTTLTVDLSGISDRDGLNDPQWTYGWWQVRNGVEDRIDGSWRTDRVDDESYSAQCRSGPCASKGGHLYWESSDSLDVGKADEGHRIKVTVWFSDDRGHRSSMSATTGVIQPLLTPADLGANDLISPTYADELNRFDCDQDFNDDGVVETIGFDLDGDGSIDADEMGEDINGDGVVNSGDDTNGDLAFTYADSRDCWEGAWSSLAALPGGANWGTVTNGRTTRGTLDFDSHTGVDGDTDVFRYRSPTCTSSNGCKYEVTLTRTDTDRSDSNWRPRVSITDDEGHWIGSGEAEQTDDGTNPWNRVFEDGVSVTIPENYSIDGRITLFIAVMASSHIDPWEGAYRLTVRQQSVP